MPELNYVPLKDYDFGYDAKFPLPWNPTVYCLIAALSALPLWMTLELTFQIYATFKKYSGLYFWSLLFCTWSISIRQIGRICIYFVPGCSQVFSLIFAMLGWVGTVTGFSVVLYSRLNLVTRNRRIIRGVLAMIIANVIILHFPTMMSQIGVVTRKHKEWTSWYRIMEKIQILGFTTQETIISSLYIWATRKIINDSFNTRTKHSLRLLILVQICCIFIDVPFIVLGFTDLLLIKITLTSFAYAIKLKLEFLVLNELVGIVKDGIAPRGIHHLDEEQATLSPDRKPSGGLLNTTQRRFSMSPFQRWSTTIPPLTEATTGTGITGFSKEINTENDVHALQQVRMNSEGPAAPTLARCTADDTISPHQDEDTHFTKLEKQYLGQYGQDIGR